MLGKHTDYAGGQSLLAALDLGVTVTVRDAARGTTAVTTAQPGEVDVRAAELPAGHWGRYVRTVVDRLERNFGPIGPCRIEIDSTLPLASGMSSSSALLVATALGLARHHGLDQSEPWQAELGTPERLATYLACIENGSSLGPLVGDAGVGTFGGSEDHTAMLCCREQRLARYRFGPAVLQQQIPLPDRLVFVVCMSGVRAEKTGAARDAYNQASARARQVVELWNQAEGRHDAGIGQALQAGPGAADRLRELVAASPELTQRLEHFLLESETYVPQAAAALVASDLDRFAEVAQASHEAADRLLGNLVDQTRALASSARELGGYGASAFGAGFGGSVWALVAADQAAGFAQRWLTRYRSEFPRQEGVSVSVVRPSGPARQV